MFSRYKFLILLPPLFFPFDLTAEPQLPLGSGGKPIPAVSEDGVYSLTMNIINPEQVDAYQEGKDPSEIILITGETLEEFLSVDTQRMAMPSAPRGSVSSGGESESMDGRFKLNSSIGQPVAGVAESSDGTIKLSVGFQTPSLEVFGDGFESGDIFRWSSNKP